MQTEFVQGTNSLLLNALGNIPYGHFTSDDETVIVSLEQGRAVLTRYVHDHGLSSDDAMIEEEAMVAAGLLADDAAVVANIKAHELSADYTDDGKFTFQVHEDCTSNPLPHGHTYTFNGLKGPASCDVMDHAFPAIEGVVDGDSLDVDNGIRLLQQMIDADLPLNREDARRRFMDLPEEVRLPYEERAALLREQGVDYGVHLEVIVVSGGDIGHLLGQILSGGGPRL